MAFLRILRLMLRGLALIVVLLWGIVLTLLLLPFRLFGERVRERLLQPVARHWFRMVRAAMGVQERCHGRPAHGPVLLAANHISWLDIVVLGCHVGACFVSKSEVAAWPVLGWLAKQGGTLFIHRGRHESAARIAHEMTERLQSGGRLLFFPEGTTSDGTSVRRFRNRLFQPAVECATPVQAVAIRYRRGSEAVDPVAYLPGVTLVQSAIGVLARPRTIVDIRWGRAVESRGIDRRELAALVEQEVVAEFSAIREESRDSATLSGTL